MPVEFPYDVLLNNVLLNHSAKDRPVVREVAERLKKDRLRPPSQLSTINTQFSTGSDWAQMESCTLRFRDPLNKERRLILMRFHHGHIRRSTVRFPLDRDFSDLNT